MGRVEKIKSQVSILQLLEDLGYQVRPEFGDREQQFPCSLHGDGADNKPSARVYPESESWYCWGCNKSRDVIETVKDQEDISFMQACSWIEISYKLERHIYKPKENPPIIAVISAPVVTADSLSRRVDSYLQAATKDRLLPMRNALRLWQAFDGFTYYFKKGSLKEDQVISNLESLLNKAKEEVQQYGREDQN